MKGVPREPTGTKFIPVGHTGLELCPQLIDRFGFPSSSIRVTSLYISWYASPLSPIFHRGQFPIIDKNPARALQSGGFGRSAMSQTERLATQPPHSATLIVLDTMQRETQLSEDYQRFLYDTRGMERPEKPRSAQDWYERLGYDVIPTDEDEPYPWRNDVTGEVLDVPVVWLKKTLLT